MKKIARLLLASLALGSFTVKARAGAPAPVADGKTSKDAVSLADSAWSTTLMGAGIKTSDSYTDGNFFLTVPVWSTIGTDGTLGGNYLFIEPYASVGSGGEVAASLGASWRHLFSRESSGALKGRKGRAGFMEEGWFVGGSLFVDMLDTEHHNSF